MVPPTGAQEQNQPRVSMQSRSRGLAGLGISETWRESRSCCVCPPLPNSLMLLWATPDLRGLEQQGFQLLIFWWTILASDPIVHSGNLETPPDIGLSPSLPQSALFPLSCFPSGSAPKQAPCTRVLLRVSF